MLESQSVTGSSRIDVLLIEDLSQQRLPARTLAALLQQAGLRTRLVHFGPDQDADAVVRLAERERPDLVISSILFAHRVPEYLALITALRRAVVHAHFTVVGPLPSFAFVELLAACPALDSVLCGEAEASVVQLATSLNRSQIPSRGGSHACPERSRRAAGSRAWEPALLQNRDLLRLWDPARWQAVPGLAYRSPAPHANPLPKPLASLDALPFPAHDDGIPVRLGYGFATVEGSRGCYHACTFCLPCAFHRAAGAPHYRLRSPAHLVDEIEALYQQGTRLFLFDDEQFLPPGHTRGNRVAELHHELERRRLRIAFTIKCRADDVDAALFRQLKEMGLLRVYVGVESGCQASLDLLGKGVTVQRNAEALAVLDKLDIVADFRSLLFHPWSTLETVQADIGFLHSMVSHVATCFSFHEVEVYPGTPLAERLRAEGRGEGDPWPLSYTLTDPRAELVRRLSRFVFDPSGAHADIQSLLTQAWYDLSLQRHFRPAQFEESKARKLRAIAASVNAQSLHLWREMLTFVGEGDIYDTDWVNERACAWASHIHSCCLRAEDELADLISSVSE